MKITLKQFADRLRNAPSDLQSRTQEIIEPGTDYFIAIQKTRILSGKTHTEDQINYKFPRKDTPSSAAYTRQYVRFKDKRGGQTNHVDLKLDGTFLKSMQALAKNEAFVVTFTDKNKGKVSGILTSYDNLIGISPREISIFNEQIEDTLTDTLQNILLG